MRRSRFRTLSLIAPLVLTAIAPQADLIGSEDYDPKRFEKTEVVGNLNQPMELAIAPDGSLFLIELAGEIKRIDPKKLSMETIGQISVTTEQENGLIGLALDPDFATNGWLYLQYSPPTFSGQHVSRFTFRDGKLDLKSEVLLLKYEEQRQECCHHAGSLAFGPDGCLYISAGDNTNPFGDSGGYAPIDERESRGAFNALRTSSNTKNYNGKILRIRPKPEGGYSIPEGNLFPADGSMGHPEIYVMGCRNPWRISVDSKTGFLYWGDVGPDAGGDNERGPRGYDEVNQAKKAGYFGWPLFIANNQPYAAFDFQSKAPGERFDPQHPVNRSIYNTGSQSLPPAQPAWIYYPGGPSKEFPELGAGGRTACAGPAYDYQASLESPTKFPEHFHRCLFIYEWSRNWIAAVHLNEDSSIQRIEPFLPSMSFTRPIDMEFDRNGVLYVIEYGETWGRNPDAKLVRLDYHRGNRNPTAQIRTDRTAGKEPLKVKLTSEGSIDKDGDSLTYRWLISQVPTMTDDEGDAKPSSETETRLIGTTPELDWLATERGVYNVQLEVSDPQGAKGKASLSLVVGNAVPEIQFVRPSDGDFFELGERVSYKIKVKDLEDGTSDSDEADENDLEFIDADAPNRVSLQASMVAGGATDDSTNLPPGLRRMRSSDCFNCHSVETPLIGPAFVDIAKKYRDQPGAIEASIERVRVGSTGVWGKVPMLPHEQFTQSEIREMVEWVFAAIPNPSTEYRSGLSNIVELLTDKKEFNGKIRLHATYRDKGWGTLPSLSASQSIELRSRTLQSEAADKIHDMQILGSHSAENGKFCGAINHGSYLRVDRVPMNQFRTLTASVASAGAGGKIEVRLNAPDGPLLGTMDVKVNGKWEEWYQVSLEKPADITSESEPNADLYFVCIHDEKRSGLMNIDWIRFVK
ncbi:PQQ-dependent sugar dehydrogenase [Pirellulaceae bacterium SH501]